MVPLSSLGKSSGLLVQEKDGYAFKSSNLDVQKVDSRELKSEEKARQLALLYTLVPTIIPGVNVIGWIAGPAAGSFYAGNKKEAWKGIAFRTGAFALGTAGTVGLLLNMWYDDESGSNRNLLLPAIAALGGHALWIWSAAKHINKVGPESVRQYNARTQKQTSVAILPYYHPEFRTFGLSAQIRF